MFRVDVDKLRSRRWTDSQIDAHRRALQTAVNEIVRLWANSYRYASEERLRLITGRQRIKGDYLKELARQFLGSAERIIDKGIVLWHV